MGRLIIDGNRVYELDEACLQRRRKAGKMPENRDVQMQKERQKQMQKKERT